ncbi:MAG: TRAP transporter large permease [Pseudomonadota bacterium]
MLDRETIGIIGIGVLFLLLMLRMPVGLAMLTVGIGGNYFISLAMPAFKFAPFIKQFKTLLWGVVGNYDLSVVPLFILMGFLASHSKLSSDLFRGFNALVGRFRGGVAMAAIGACAGFGAVCGSSLATASTMGKVALPELKRLKYAPRLATGSLAAGGTLGILIPPSVALVIYAVIVEASIVDMFQAAIVPGLLAVVFFIVVIWVSVRLKPDLAPNVAKLSKQEFRTAVWRLLPVLTIFGVIILGLGLGIFTPTPAAAFGATVIMLYGLFLRFTGLAEGLTNEGLKNSILSTAVTAGMIYFILFGAEVLKIFFARAGLPAALSEWAVGSGIDPWGILIFMLIALIILGCFMDSLAMILVVIPFFWPALVELNGGDWVTAESAAFGMDIANLQIWFGILALIVVELGLITPPVGLNVFIISQMAKDTKMAEVFKGVMPFFGIELVRVALLLLFPILALYLPNILSG